MRAKCSAYGCKAATYNKLGYILSFHRFPKDPERQQQWKDFCKNTPAMNKSYKSLWLCGSHFEKSCYYINNDLRSDALPTIRHPASRTSFNETSNQTETDSNDCSLIEANANGESNRDIKLLPNESIGMNIQKEAPTSAIDDEDDFGSVHFSSNEDEDPDGEATIDWEKEDACSENIITIKQGEILYSTGPNLNQHPQQGPSTVSAPVEPVYTKLPSVSPPLKTQTSSQHPQLPSKSPFKRSVSDKTVKGNSELPNEEDDCSTFAAHVKTRMRNFNHVQKILAQKLISDIMFMADTRQLKLGSAIVNSQPLASTSQVNNGVPKKATGGSFFAYIDSDDDDRPSAKKPK